MSGLISGVRKSESLSESDFMKKFYITTTLPYVNAEPHIGFALETVQADTVARYHRLIGDGVVFNFGTDEHGLKIYRKAGEAGKTPKEYVDEYAAKFEDLRKVLNLSYNKFVRTTDDYHIEAAREFWKRCEKNGDIYKKKYKTKYCVGCELEKTDSELVDGRCSLHPNRELEIIEEENYFFKFSKYQKPLLEFYEKNPNFVVPIGKYNEIKSFVETGLRDFSISRLKKKMPWGIDIPGDPEHVMYVWFDALVNYISTIGWPKKMDEFETWWPVVQIAGKDNLRQQAAIWQAMLMSAGIENSRQVFIHGFITINGQKVSKSLGNSVSLFDLVSKYGTDAVRYYLLSKVHPYEDSDYTTEKFEEAYTADLANGIGNLAARVSAMAESVSLEVKGNSTNISSEVCAEIKIYRFDKALDFVWKEIKTADTLINEKRVWELKEREQKEVLTALVNQIRQIAIDLQPFLPETAEKILKQFEGPKIVKGEPLFPRKDK